MDSTVYLLALHFLTLLIIRSTAQSIDSCAKLPLDFFNNLDVPVGVYVTGQTAENRDTILSTDNTFLTLPIASSTPTPIVEQNFTHYIDAKQSSTLVLPDCLISARIWIAENASLQFEVVKSSNSQWSSLVVPTYNTYSHVSFDFIEMSYQPNQLTANPTYVDGVTRLNIQFNITLQNGGDTLSSRGLKAGALQGICSDLQKVPRGPWADLCVREYEPNGRWLRAYSPDMFLSLESSRDDAFDAYFNPSIEAVWTHFTSRKLSINLSATERATCSVNRQSNSLDCDLTDLSFVKPTAQDILSCDGGPFINNASANDNQKRARVVLAAAFNRGTLLSLEGSSQPDACNYYPTTGANISTNSSINAFNWYSKIVHEWEESGEGYAFPDDDVTGCYDPNPGGLLLAATPSKLGVWIGSSE